MNINNELSYKIIECDEIPSYEDNGMIVSYIIPNYAQFYGNYVYACTQDLRYAHYDAASSIYHTKILSSMLDKNGKWNLFEKTYAIPAVRNEAIKSKQATDFYIDYLISDRASLTIQDYVYWIIGGNNSYSNSGRYFMSNPMNFVCCKNLLTNETTTLLDFSETDNVLMDPVNNIFPIYVSVSKAILLHAFYKSDYYQGVDSRSIIITLQNGNAMYKSMQDMFIRVYGEKRQIHLMANYSSEIYDKLPDIEKDEISLIGGVEKFRYFRTEKALPTMQKGLYKPDAVEGMAFRFTYGDRKRWEIQGYMYIDNFDFTESENNYIYILEEYENGELVFAR